MVRRVSQEVKRQYEAKHNTIIRVYCDKEVTSEFKKKCVRNNVSYNSVLAEGIKHFMLGGDD